MESIGRSVGLQKGSKTIEEMSSHKNLFFEYFFYRVRRNDLGKFELVEAC